MITETGGNDASTLLTAPSIQSTHVDTTNNNETAKFVPKENKSFCRDSRNLIMIILCSLIIIVFIFVLSNHSGSTNIDCNVRQYFDGNGLCHNCDEFTRAQNRGRNCGPD